MSIINIKNLTFSYSGSYNNIFENISLNIDTSWRLGLIGRNGRGKTTFLKILMGEEEYSGSITGDVKFEYFPFSVRDESEFTIDVIKDISGVQDYDYWKIQKEIYKLECNEDVLYRPFNSLSGGEKVKILLASLFLKENAFLLIDEPTNHLDTQTRKIVCEYIRSKKGFILVSHDRYLLDNCVDHILCINKANIEIQKGNFTTWNENKERQDNFEIASNEKLEKEITRLKNNAKQLANWSNNAEKAKNGTRIGGLRPNRGYIGHKSAKMMKRSKSAENKIQSAIESKSELLKNIEYASELKMNYQKYRSERLLRLTNLSLFYDNNKEVCSNVNLEVNQGDRIAICGKNGCGKSTILKFINGGSDIKSRGDIFKPGDLKISYISQDTSNLSGDLRSFAQENGIDESLFKTILRKLDFSRLQFEKNIEDFSDGQKKKVLIAKSLCEEANLYLWDEPLNFIDILSRIQIEDLILKSKPTIIFVEHDEYFVKNISTRILNL